MIRKIEAYVLCPKQEQSFFFSQWTYEEEILSHKNRNRTRRFGGGEGNEPNPEIGKVCDGGIDFDGVLDVNGIASINLQVQVKRYDNSSIGEKEIRSFRGALKQDYQGCFITLSKFQKKAIESSTKEGYKGIQLIDGNKFI